MVAVSSGRAWCCQSGHGIEQFKERVSFPDSQDGASSPLARPCSDLPTLPRQLTTVHSA